MSWYTFIKLSQNWQTYVKENLNVDDSVVADLESISDDKRRNIIINELRKNPGSSVKQISESMQPRKEYSPTTQEERVAGWFEPSKLVEWALVQLRKLRRKEKNESWRGEEVQDFVYDQEAYSRLFNRPKMQEIQDWWYNQRPEIASYTAEEAIRASDEWHDRISEGTDVVKYEEGESGVIYGPKWKNENFNGWTIRKITTSNDADYEGHLMDHCVGSYSCNILDGSVRVFSLRDPNNKPHVTMEVSPGSWTFKQIYGKSNSEPKSKYKKILKEWIQTLTNPSIKSYTEYDDYHDAPVDADDVPEWLHSAIFKNEEYGVVDYVSDFKFEDAYRESYSALLDGYGDDNDVIEIEYDKLDPIYSVAHTLVKACVAHDRYRLLYFKEEMEVNLTHMPNEAARFAFISPKQNEFETNNLIDTINRISDELDDVTYKKEVENREIDYYEIDDGFSIETPKDVSKRIKQSYATRFMPFAIGVAMEKELKSQLAKNPLPVFEWMKMMRGGFPKYTKYQDVNSTKKASLNMNFYKKAQMYSADEIFGDGDGVFGHPDDYADRPTGQIRSRIKHDLNRDLKRFLSPDGKTEYFNHIPLSDIFDIIEGVGLVPVDEDGSRWEGMLAGEDGRATIELIDSEDSFKSLNMHIQWHKMQSGKYEINAYVN
jgi:hypothetical protein